MSKCNFETQCKGNGTCCAFCEHEKSCDTKCQMFYMTYGTQEKRQKSVVRCDWFQSKENSISIENHHFS